MAAIDWRSETATFEYTRAENILYDLEVLQSFLDVNHTHPVESKLGMHLDEVMENMKDLLKTWQQLKLNGPTAEQQ